MNLERIADHTSNIAACVLQIDNNAMGAHRYLEIVRAPMLGQPLEAYHWWIVIGCTVADLLGTTVLMRQWRARVSYWV